MRGFRTLLIFLVCLFSTVSADFGLNTELVEALKAKNIKLVVLCNFPGTNNLLGIVTSSDSPGYELTANGISMLNEAVSILKRENVNYIFTAPTFRAQQATNLFGKAFGLPVNRLVIDNRLAMQNFGSADGEDFDVYKARFSSFQDMLENIPPNGEAGQSVFDRTEEFLFSLTDYENQNILIITHAFNYCHISKSLTGKFGPLPFSGKFTIYDSRNL